MKKNTQLKYPIKNCTIKLNRTFHSPICTRHFVSWHTSSAILSEMIHWPFLMDMFHCPCLFGPLFMGFFGYLPIMPVIARDRAGASRNKAGISRDKQRQTGTFPFCLCLSLSVHACSCFSLSVTVCPCIPFAIPSCLPLHMNITVFISRT